MSRFIRFLAVAQLLLVSILSMGCDSPRKAVRTYFQSLRLNQLSIPRTGIEPGDIFISGLKDGNREYAGRLGNLFGTSYTPPEDKDRTSDFEATIGSYHKKRAIKSGLAIKFIGFLLGTNLAPSLSFSSAVIIDPIEVKGNEIDIEVIQDFLSSSESVKIRERVAKFENFNEGAKIHICYEIFKARSLKIKTGNNTRVTGSMQIGQSRLIESGNSTVEVVLEDEYNLVLDKRELHAFAVRAIRVERTNKGEAPPVYEFVELESVFRTHGRRPSSLCGQGQSPENCYVTSVIGNDFKPIDLRPINDIKF